MDYLLVALSSILFPYILSITGVDYKANIGMFGSLQNNNIYKLELEDKSNKYYIFKHNLVTYTGYGVRPDFFVDYSINKGKIFLSPTFGWEPLITGISYSTKIKGGSDGSIAHNGVYYSKLPYISCKLGLTIFKSNPELNSFYASFGLTPYIIGGVVPVSYESEAYYQSLHEKRYNFYYGAGIKIESQSPWAIFLQYKHLNFNTLGSSLDKQLIIKESEIQFGLAYWFRTNYKKSKVDRVQNYDNIINTINTMPLSSKNIKKSTEDFSSFTNTYDDTNNKNKNSILENNKRLKEESPLLKKAKKTKSKENYDLNILDNDF